MSDSKRQGRIAGLHINVARLKRIEAQRDLYRKAIKYIIASCGGEAKGCGCMASGDRDCITCYLSDALREAAKL